MPLARYPAQPDPGLYVPFTAPNTSAIAIYFRRTRLYRIRPESKLQGGGRTGSDQPHNTEQDYTLDGPGQGLGRGAVEQQKREWV